MIQTLSINSNVLQEQWIFFWDFRWILKQFTVKIAIVVEANNFDGEIVGMIEKLIKFNNLIGNQHEFMLRKFELLYLLKSSEKHLVDRSIFKYDYIQCTRKSKVGANRPSGASLFWFTKRRLKKLRKTVVLKKSLMYSERIVMTNFYMLIL